VKFIRPENFAQYNLHQESYTSLLWIFEGFTSYYDDLILLRSGVISQTSYLKLLKAQMDRYLQNPGRFIQSVSESSFDAWIKFYRQDENSNNAGTSYYNKGALVALCLDLGYALMTQVWMLYCVAYMKIRKMAFRSMSEPFLIFARN
jgi:predicted metalloprotease with PDZ domain